MGVTLQQALASQQNLLGKNYENLGKEKRIYLSFEQSRGWSVENFTGCLGFIKNILRYLGFYASTRLQSVALQIQREPGAPAALLSKINACQQKSLSQVIPPERLPRVNEPSTVVAPDPTIPSRLGVYIGRTLVSIEQGDITQAKVKAIVNAAKNSCLGGGGIDAAVHSAAGPALLADCQKLPEVRPGVRCETGKAVITVSGNLAERGIERVIHAVGPIYNPKDREGSAALLKSAYLESLEVAYKNGIRTIAFPAISTGLYFFPFEEATKIAIETVETYAHEHPDRFNEIKLVFWGDMYTPAAAITKTMAHPHA